MFVVIIKRKEVTVLILEEEVVEIKWHPSNKQRYINRGYIYTKMKDSFFAKVRDVIECSDGAKIPVRCDYCGEIYYPTTRTYLINHNKGQEDCCVSCKGNKIRKTVQEKYGVNNVSQMQEVRDKMKATCLDKYGVESPLALPSIYEETQKTFNKHYGTVNGIKDLRTVKELSDKIAKTNIKRYGGVSPFASKEVRKKIKEQMYKNGTCATSGKQLKLQEIIKKKYGNCELNYPCGESFLDCMTIINGIKIDIEYDGWYWHKDREKQDRNRDYFVESNGYKVLRFLAYADRLPTEEELTTAIKQLTTTNKKHLKVELNKV